MTDRTFDTRYQLDETYWANDVLGDRRITLDFELDLSERMAHPVSFTWDTDSFCFNINHNADHTAYVLKFWHSDTQLQTEQDGNNLWMIIPRDMNVDAQIEAVVTQMMTTWTNQWYAENFKGADNESTNS